MALASNDKDKFVHQIAIKLSRQLNIINPNDLLAERVIDIAKTKTVGGFAAGVCFAAGCLFQAYVLTQLRDLLASSRIHFCWNCMPRFCRMKSKWRMALSHNLFKASL